MNLGIRLGSLAFANILLGFIYQWYIVTTVGPGAETDALYAGMVIPQLILAIFSGSLAHVLVPLLSNQKGNQFCKDAWNFFQSTLVLYTGTACILVGTAKVWVPVIVPGFDVNTKSLTVSILRIQLIGMVFTGLTSVLWSVNHARRRFVWVEMSTILANIVSLIFLFGTLPRLGVMAAAWTTVLQSTLQTGFLFKGLGAYHKPDWRSNSLKEAWCRLKPLLLGNSYYKTDQLVDRFLASMAPAGGLTLLYMAQQLYGAGNTILGKSIVTPMIPIMSQKAHVSDWEGFRFIFLRRLFVMLVLTSLGFLVVLIFGKPLLTLLFGYKNFNIENVRTLWWLLLALAGVWMGGAMGSITSTTYYSKGDTRTPTKLGVMTYTAYIPLKILSFVFFGLMGLAISASLYYMANLILQFYFLKYSPE